MADTFTAHYNLTKPQIGGDPDTWGTLLNANFDAIDSQLFTASTYAVPLAGGTMTGNLGITTAGPNGLTVSSSSTNAASIVINSTAAGGHNWAVSSSGGGGAAAGAFALYDNTANALRFSISPAGVATFSARPVFGAATPWDSANLTPSSYAPLAGAAFTGAVSVTTTGTNGLNVASSSTNSASLLVNNTAAGGHSWSIASSGGGPGPAGTLVLYDNTSGGAQLTLGGNAASVPGSFSAGGNIATTQTGAGQTATITADGGASGTSGGSYIVTRLNGVASIAIGNRSAINGGAYDTTPILLHNGTLVFENGSDVQTATLDTAGNFTAAGVTITSSQNFVSSTAAAVFAPTGAGTVYLRPNGPGSTTGQMTLSSAGLAQAPDFQATSDERLKTDVQKLRRGLDELKRMPPVEYVKAGKEEIGFIAQDAQMVIPEAVSVNTEGFLTLSYGQVTALIASAVLELEHRMTMAGI